LPEEFFAEVAGRVARVLDSEVTRNWLWEGRPFDMFDGTTVSMHDTRENVEAYPKTKCITRMAAWGFLLRPLAR
jgi:hypothetical protein